MGSKLYDSELKVGWMTLTIWVTFDGSSGSHLQTKLSGCDPDITCSLENKCWHLVSEWTLLWVWWMHWNIMVWNKLIISSCFKACGVQSFQVCARDWICILPRMKKSMALFHIKNFYVMLQHVGCIWIVQWVKWVNRSNPLSGSQDIIETCSGIKKI